MTKMQPSPECLVTAYSALLRAYNEVILDALAKLLQEEGANEFQDEFFE
jgi:hypothetical protein